MSEATQAHPADVQQYLARLYDEKRRQYACRATAPAEFASWQAQARPELRRLLGIPRIAADVGTGAPSVQISEGEDMDTYIRKQGAIETEPNVAVRFWLLQPKSPGPWPLALTPHGHENGDHYVGIGHDDRSRAKIAEEDRDVAVQAVQRGYMAVAPATRGIGKNPASYRIDDIGARHDGHHCRCHNWQVIAVGRTLMGERVWDLMRLLDWALALPEVDASRVLMLGNSGGGMATLHAAACDERIGVAVPCCAFNNYISPHGTLRHCTCNAIPGLLDFGEYWDVAGLVAPRSLLTVNGRQDPLHPVAEVDQAVARLQAIYSAAGAATRYEHRYGEAGHRFYRELMWPWIEAHG